MEKSNKKKIKENIKTDNSYIFSEPKIIKFKKDLIQNSTECSTSGFCVIKSLDNISYLVYNSDSKNIIFFNIKNDNINAIIKKAHPDFIRVMKHYQDKKKKRDLLLTSSHDCVKIWNIKNLESFFVLKNPKELKLQFEVSCFLNIKNDINVVIKKHKLGKKEEKFIEIYNLNKEKIKVIKDNNTKDFTIFLDSYYNNDISYIILCNENFLIKVYNYNKNTWTIYRAGYGSGDWISQFEIINNNGALKIIGATSFGIYLWDFKTGKLLSTIKEENERNSPFGLCLWNNDNLFAGLGGSLNLIKIKSDKLIKTKKFSRHKEFIPCIKKIFLPFYGECLISQDYLGIIKLWANNHK